MCGEARAEHGQEWRKLGLAAWCTGSGSGESDPKERRGRRACLESGAEGLRGLDDPAGQLEQEWLGVGVGVAHCCGPIGVHKGWQSPEWKVTPGSGRMVTARLRCAHPQPVSFQ